MPVNHPLVALENWSLNKLLGIRRGIVWLLRLNIRHATVRKKRTVHGDKFRLIRQLTLYSMDEEPSYELELCPMRKKVAISAFLFFPPVCRFEFTWPVLFSPEYGYFHWKSPNFSFLLFFPPTPAGQDFFDSDIDKNPMLEPIIRRI